MLERGGVLGKVGTELYAEACSSALFPNPLGIRLKTKISVYYFSGYLVVIICWLSCIIHLLKAELGMSTYFVKWLESTVVQQNNY